MAEREALVRERLERQLKHRLPNPQSRNSLQFVSSFENDIESLKSSLQQDNVKIYRCLEGHELQLELNQQRDTLHQFQLNVDTLRIKMLEITKEEDLLRESIVERRKYYNQIRGALDKQHRVYMEAEQRAQNTKKESILVQIEGLIQEKGQLLGQIEKLGEELKKSELKNRRAQQNYSKQMKSRKQAYLNIERDKNTKYQASKIQKLKEKAIKDTEPKLVAIIKSSKDQIKKAEDNQKSLFQDFKIQYKLKLEKNLTQAKERAFEEAETEKEQLRVQTESKNREKYLEREKEGEENINWLRQDYNMRIKEEEKKMRADVEEFILRNKNSYNASIQEIRILKDSYESKIKKMNENLVSIKGKKLQEYEVKYQQNSEVEMRQIATATESKWAVVEQKIKKDISEKIEKVKGEVSKEKHLFLEEINNKYEKILIQEMCKLDELAAKEKLSIQDYQTRIIQLQKLKSKEESKVQQFKKERNGLLIKNEDLERKINEYDAQLQAYERYKFDKQKQVRAKCEQNGVEFQNHFQKLKQKYLRKEEQRQAQARELLDEFQIECRRSENDLQELHNEVQGQIKRKKEELKKILEESSKTERENQQLQIQIDQMSKKIRN